MEIDIDGVLNSSGQRTGETFAQNTGSLIATSPGNMMPFGTHMIFARATNYTPTGLTGQWQQFLITVSAQPNSAQPNSAPTIESINFSVNENSLLGTEVGTVEATDADGDELTFSIESETKLGSEENRFAIDAHTGMITVARNDALNFEEFAEIEVTVKVSDGQLSATKAIKVEVENVNEKPEFKSHVRKTVNAGFYADSTLGYHVATDPDSDPLYFSFTATDAAYQSYFSIDNDGTLKLIKNPLEAFRGKTVSLELTVSDQKGNGSIDTKMVDVLFTNVSVSVSGDYQAIEGADGKDTITITFLRSGEFAELVNKDLIVKYEFSPHEFAAPKEDANESAKIDLDNDFEQSNQLDEFKSGQITIKAGELEKTVTLTAKDDAAGEKLERLFLELIETNDYSVDDTELKEKDEQETASRALLEIVDSAGITLFAKQNEHVRLADDADSLGIDQNDVFQKGIGDCWLHATVVALTQTPAGRTHIHQMFRTVEGEDTKFQVRLWKINTVNAQGHPVFSDDSTFTKVWVEVDFDLKRGGDQAALSGDYDEDGKIEVWTLVLEHAVAELYTWKGINGNSAEFAWLTLTGQPASTFVYDYAKGIKETDYRNQVFTAIKTAFDSGKGIYFSTKDTFGPNAATEFYLKNGSYITGDHAYTVVAVEGGLITLNNPWGLHRTIQITINEMHEVLERYYTFDLLE